MKTYLSVVLIACIVHGFLTGCCRETRPAGQSESDSLMKARVGEFAVVRLTTDLSLISESEKKMIPMLIEAARIIDDLFWQQAFSSDKTAFLDSLADRNARIFAEINYGPWEQLNGNKPFLPGYGEKPAGACFYPVNMTKEEFEKWDNPDKSNQYTLIRRDASGSLCAVWYHEAYREKLEQAAGLLKSAAALAEDQGLRNYLELRAEALVSDDYYPSDMAWMDMKNNTIDIVIGPIENYEDKLYGYKTAFECALLIKDKEWSRNLEKFAAYLPDLQRQLPVDDLYKKEKPGTDSDLNAYDIIYCAGDMNAGSKTIAINLPNDERVQLQKGSRRLQLKNAMRAKFDYILVPISDVLIDPAQRGNIKFDAFFSNVMFHEVAHGLGIKQTVKSKGTVREALKEKYSAFEEAKADVLGLFMTVRLIEMGELTGISPEDCFVTYMAGMFRSVRFGAASAHGKANMMCFNYFKDKGAFERSDKGTYRVNFEKIREAMNGWAEFILVLQGDGNYDLADRFLNTNGLIKPELQAELDLLKSSHIPVDIVYDQGVTVLGLTE